MKVRCDKVITSDHFDAAYSSWKGRTLTIMGDYIKVTQSGLQPRYYDTIYLFENTGLMIGFKYGSPVSECYLSTQDGQESECYVDALPYLFEDCHRTYAIVKNYYKNYNLKRQVIGLGIIDISTLTSLNKKYVWPMWESIDSIHNGAIVIRKSEEHYGMSTVDKFPTCNLVDNAIHIKRIKNGGNVYKVSVLNNNNPFIKTLDFTEQLSKIRLPK